MKKNTLLKIAAQLKPYIFYLILLLIFALVSVLCSLYIPVLIGDAIDLTVEIFNKKQEANSLVSVLLTAALFAACSALAQWFMNICGNKITYNTIRDMRSSAFEKIHRLPFSYIDTHETGDIVSRIINDVDQFADGLLMGFSQLFTAVVTVLGTLVFMLRLNARIAVVVVVITPLSIFVARFIAKKTYSMFKLQTEARGKQTGFVNEMITNQKVVKAFGREEESLREFDILNENLRKYTLRATFFSSITNPSTRFINSLVYAAVALCGALTVIAGGGFTVGMLTCFLSYANQYTKPFNEISSVITELQGAIASAERLLDFLDAEELPCESGSMEPTGAVKGQVDIEDLSFSYSAERPLISDFSLSVKQGSRVAIVGPTGCGKTTFINLLMRFYEPDSGRILIDYEDISDMTRHSLRRRFGMVLQDTWLCWGTVRDNIRLGVPTATDEEVIAAAKAAHAHSFIKQLPNGYDTVISDGGNNLSAGQRQLLCIARIMLSLPPMLILDEATSSIDTRTELRIQRAFAKLMKGRTSFIVAHRLSTIKEADVILVMKDGKIIEQGEHQSLMAQNGFYKELYESQFNCE